MILKIERRKIEEMKVWFIMHIYMEMSQRNYLCSYLKQAKMSLFSFAKSQNRRAEHVLYGGRGVGTNESGKDVGKECRKVNIVQILCTHVCK
jgi:hypothetical protein